MPAPPASEQQLANWRQLRAAGMMPRLGLSPIWQAEGADGASPTLVVAETHPRLHQAAEQGWQDEGGQNGG